MDGPIGQAAQVVQAFPKGEQVSRAADDQVETGTILRRAATVHDNRCGRRLLFDEVSQRSTSQAWHRIIGNDDFMD
jgi:hypothetical protein